jgi:putative peptide zinc metalloprotease protein
VAVPVPMRTVAQGVWWQAEDALVRTEVDGFVAEVRVQPGQAVRAGEVLLRLHAPAVEAEAAQLAARIEALQSEHWHALRDDPPRAVQVEHELAASRAALERTQALLDSRQVRARADGRVAMAGVDDLPGRWLPRGSQVAHLVTDAPPVVQVAVPHDDASLVAQASRRVEVRRADARSPALAAQWDGHLSGAGAALPSAALGSRAGGAIATDPADAQGLAPLRAVAIAQVRLDPGQPGTQADRIGERVLVRFEHGARPLAWQAARAVRQQVLRHLTTGSR